MAIEEDNSGDGDEFWQVALAQENTARIIDSDSEDEACSPGSTATITYSIPWKATRTISLKLSPLPDHDGIWSPLGAQSWHAASLLVAYLLKNTILANPQNPPSLLDRHLRSCLQDPSATTSAALELGSGAVGLVGIVLGLILSDYSNTFGEKCDEVDLAISRVILTDNEPSVLKNLQENIDKMLVYLESEKEAFGWHLPEFRVEHLDWGDDVKQSELQLVVGSELVYTHETAEACAKAVLSLLNQNQDALVFILQVTDRDGWSNVFLPALRENDHIQIIMEDEAIHDFGLHELAATLIPPGGTLDRFAYGGVFIFHKSGRVASLVENSI